MTDFDEITPTRRDIFKSVVRGGAGAAALLSPGLYGLASGFATPAHAEEATFAERLQRLRIGEMRKLEPAEAPDMAPIIEFMRADGSKAGLQDWIGKSLLVNFWATWCAPCVKELPSIDRLAARVAAEGLGEKVAVLTISLDRGSAAKPQALFDRIGVKNLELLQDPTMAAGRVLRLTGMPTTLLIDPQGREVARLLGDAEWDSGEAFAVIEELASLTEV